MKKSFFKSTLMLAALVLTTAPAFAGVGAIDSVTAELATYVDSIGNLILIIGAIVGLVGGVRVYVKWNNGDQDVNKAIMGWMGSCMFLVLVGTIVNAFFI
ncbi:MAG: DUF4134 domain-containing protein [Flavobacteriales bacterium]|jgi:heme/copper-type cytochrome/quinol oxidase subunit 2